MAIGFNGSGDYAKYVGAPAIRMTVAGDKFTIAGWGKVRDITPGAYSYHMGIENADSSSSAYCLIGYTSGNEAEFSNNVENPSHKLSPAPSQDTWYYFYITGIREATNTVFTYGYYTATGGSPADSYTTVGIASWDIVRIFLGADSYDEWLDSCAAYFRVWTGIELSDAQLRAERDSPTPVYTTGLYADYPLADNTDTGDDSGNGRDLTFGGTITSETSPTLSGTTEETVTLARSDGIIPADQVNVQDVATLVRSEGLTTEGTVVGAAIEETVALDYTLSVTQPRPQNTLIVLDSAILSASGQVATITAPNINISLGIGSLSANGQSTQINQAINLSASSVSATGQALQVNYAANLGIAGISASAQSITISAPAPGTSISLGTASLLAIGQTLAVVAPITRSLGAATLSTSGQAIIVSRGIVLTNAQVTAGGQTISVSAPPPGATSIPLQSSQLTASPQSLTVQKGEVTKVLNSAQLTASGQTIAVSSSVLRVLNAGALSAVGQTLTVVKGTVAIPLSAAQIASVGQFANVSAGPSPRTILLSAGQLNISSSLTIVPGAKSIAFASANISASGQSFTIHSATLRLLQVAQITSIPQTLDVVPGAVSKALSTATISALGQTAFPSLGSSPRTIALSSASLNALSQLIDIIPGAKTISVAVSQISAQPQGANIIPGTRSILFATANIVANPQTLVIQPGVATIQLGSAVITSTPQTISISAIPPGLVVQLNSAGLTGISQTLSAVPGAVIRPISTAYLAAQAQGLDVVPGEATLALSNAQINASGQISEIYRPVYLAQAVISVACPDTTVVPGNVTRLLNSAQIGIDGLPLGLMPGELSIVLQNGAITVSGLGSGIFIGRELAGDVTILDTELANVDISDVLLAHLSISDH